jgi:hypothetical protein
LVKTSTCRAVKDDGQPYGAPRLRDSEFCFWHSPDHANELAEAQRLGGLRRRKEKTVAGAYDLEGLDDVPKIRRLLEIAVLDTLSLENSVARSRTLAYLAQVALKTLEVGEFEARLEALEATMGPRLRTGRRR